jgi:hypothetical protein
VFGLSTLQFMAQNLSPARGKHQLRFIYSQWNPQWEASAELVNSPFGQNTLKIVVQGGTAWEPVTDDELTLIDRALDWLPDLLPIISSKLRESGEGLQDPKQFRETFSQASICLFGREEHPRNSWTFIVERLAFEGDNWGVHLECTGRDFQVIWAGD